MKQDVKGSLTAVSDGDVFRAQIPAVPSIQHFGKRADEAAVAPRPVVVAGHLFEALPIAHQSQHGLAEALLYCWNLGRIAPTQEHHGIGSGQGSIDILHKPKDPRTGS